MAKKKWIAGAIEKPGALHRALGIPEDQEIPAEKLRSLKSQLTKKAEGEGKLTKGDLRMLRMVNMALTLGKLPRHKGPR